MNPLARHPRSRRTKSVVVTSSMLDEVSASSAMATARDAASRSLDSPEASPLRRIDAPPIPPLSLSRSASSVEEPTAPLRAANDAF